MLVRKLCQQYCPDRLPANLGERLGDGADGEVFSLTDQPDRVIKLGVILQRTFRSPEDTYQDMKAVLSALVDRQPDAYVRVYQYGELYRGSRPWGNGTQNFLLHYSTMDKLRELKPDERDLFAAILERPDRIISSNYDPAVLERFLQEWRGGLDFDRERVMLLLDRYHAATIEHEDFHQRNIMKDANGDFKLIDLERTTIKENTDE
jgi:hypothetical protein